MIMMNAKKGILNEIESNDLHNERVAGGRDRGGAPGELGVMINGINPKIKIISVEDKGERRRKPSRTHEEVFEGILRLANEAASRRNRQTKA